MFAVAHLSACHLCTVCIFFSMTFLQIKFMVLKVPTLLPPRETCLPHKMHSAVLLFAAEMLEMSPHHCSADLYTHDMCSSRSWLSLQLSFSNSAVCPPKCNRTLRQMAVALSLSECAQEMAIILHVSGFYTLSMRTHGIEQVISSAMNKPLRRG